MFRQSEPLPIPTSAPNSEPLCYLAVNEDWVPYILGLSEYMGSDDYWDGATGDVEQAKTWGLSLFDSCLEIPSMAASPYGHFPLCIPSTALAFNPAVNANKVYYAPNWYLANYAVTDIENTELQMFRVDTTLPEGNYVMSFVGGKYSNYGKWSCTASFDGNFWSTQDAYSATATIPFVWSKSFTIAAAGSQWFDFIRRQKNPSSTGCYIAVSAIIIRKQLAGE